MGALGLGALLGPSSDGLGPPMDDIGQTDSARVEEVLEAAERREKGR